MRDRAQRLNAAPDIARALARLVLGRGGPRDLAAIRDGLAAADEPGQARSRRVASCPPRSPRRAAALRQPDRRARRGA